MKAADADLVQEAEAEQQRQAMQATSVNPNLPSPTPPPSYGGHPIEHAQRHAKGRWQ
jgi:hypothetical protein